MIDLRDQIPSGHTGRYPLVLSQVYGKAGHHTVSHIWWNTAVNATKAQEIAHLKDIDRMHAAWGLNGFGYHAAAFASGRAYKLGSYDKARAHVASGQNNFWIGFVLIGNFTNYLPSEGHLEGARECMADIDQFYGRELELRPHLLVPGQNTSCPGKRYEEWMPLLKEEEEMSEERMREIAEEIVVAHAEKERVDWIRGKINMVNILGEGQSVYRDHPDQSVDEEKLWWRLSLAPQYIWRADLWPGMRPNKEMCRKWADDPRTPE